jgi:hypothetical protein
MIGVLFAILIFGLMIWGFWRFYTNGTPPADPHNPPDLTKFTPPPPADAPPAEPEARKQERP